MFEIINLCEVNIMELVDRPSPWRWLNPYDESDVYEAEFTAGDQPYVVEFRKTSPATPSWEVSFALIKKDNTVSTEVSGTGNQFAVLSTLCDIILSFIKDERPESVQFSSDPAQRALYGSAAMSKFMNRKLRAVNYQFAQKNGLFWMTPANLHESGLLLENTERTLYHGTLRKYVASIQHVGLVPDVGAFTQRAYEIDDEDSSPIDEFASLVLAADKDGLGRCLSAIGAWIEIEYPDVRDNYGSEAIERYGALCVLKQRESDFDHRHDDEDDPPEWARQVEPGDYYSSSRVKVDFILTGKKLVGYFQRFGVFNDHGRDDPARLRERLIKLAMRKHQQEIADGKMTRQTVVQRIRDVPDKELNRWIKTYTNQPHDQ